MDRRDRQTTVHGVTESQTRLSDEHFHFSLLVFNSGVSVEKKQTRKARDWGRGIDSPQSEGNGCTNGSHMGC